MMIWSTSGGVEMATRSISEVGIEQSSAQVWQAIVRTSLEQRVPNGPIVRWGRWLRLRWKPVAVSLAFWTVYAYAYWCWLQY
jgi:hypothetical protein